MATHLNKVNNFSQISCQIATRCTIPLSTINLTVRPSCGKRRKFKFLELNVDLGTDYKRF